MVAVTCALRSRWTRPPPGIPAGLEDGEQVRLATNDQFGLAQIVTPASAGTGALSNMSKLTLSSRYVHHREAIGLAIGRLLRGSRPY